MKANMNLIHIIPVALVALCCSTAQAISASWGGLPEELLGRSMVLHTAKGGKFEAEHTPWVEQVGLHPKVFYFHNFLTNEERAHIIRLSAPVMKRSEVSGAKGEGVVDNIRTSYGMFINRLHDPIIERVQRRISLFTHLPMSHQEDIQVLRYGVNQTYGAHYDSSYDTPDDFGPHFRLATFLMYLSDVEEGGETAFPNNSEWTDPSIPEKMGPVSDCAKGHVAAKPKAGDAVLFYSYHPNKTMDEASMHTGCPVIKGIKWAAPVWIHVDEFEPQDFQIRDKRSKNRKQPVQYPMEPGLCEDMHAQCRSWAAKGECEKNPTYMVGDLSAAGVGACRKSCHKCKTCAPGDLDCINANRAQLGYLKIDREEMEWLGVDWWMGDGPSPEL